MNKILELENCEAYLQAMQTQLSKDNYQEFIGYSKCLAAMKKYIGMEYLKEQALLSKEKPNDRKTN